MWPDSKRPIGVIGAVLIGSGIAVAMGPFLFIQITDYNLSRIHRTEMHQWMQTHKLGSQGAVRRAATVIIPGLDGYLLEIPKIGVKVIVHELELDVFSGENTPMLKRYGVGQLPYTSDLRNVSPGAEGTAVITGHRTTSGAPFRHIDRLEPGDTIIIRKGTLAQRWEIEYSNVVAPSQIDAIRSTSSARRLVILACNPPFSAEERLIVHARLPGETTRETTQ